MAKPNGASKSSRFDPSAVVVPIDELAIVCGNHDVAGYWIRQLKIESAEDWQGRPALRADDARRVLEARNANKAAHDAQWAAYQKWLADHREQAARLRREEIARHHEQIRKSLTDRKLAMASRALREREEEQAAAIAAEAENRPTFEAWKRLNP